MLIDNNIIKKFDPLLFWDVDITLIDLKKNSFFIIKRIMTQGDKKDRNVLFNIYDKNMIKEVINQTREMPEHLKQVWNNIL